MGFTFCFLELIANRTFGWFEPKGLSWPPLLQFAALNGLSVATLNLALGLNSVGFYQMAKLAVIPVTVMIHTFVYKKLYSTGVKLSLLVLLLGVGIATVTDIQLNLIGSVVAIIAVLSAALSQILTHDLQKAFGLSSTQLLHNASPLMAVFLFAVGIPADRAFAGGTFLEYQYTQNSRLFLLLSCSTAIAVNLASFLVIGMSLAS